MIISVTDKMREKMTKDGSILKALRSHGGMGFGAFIAGIALLIFSIILLGLFTLLSAPRIGMFFGGILGIPGLLIALISGAFNKKKVQDYLSYYHTETGYGTDELKQIDREILAPDTIFICNATSNKAPLIGGYITKHYFVLPMMAGNSYIRRIQDIAATVYSEEIPGINGYKYGLVMVSKKDTTLSYNALLTKETCMEIIKELYKRNPRIIPNQQFTYEEKQYDVLKNWQDII